MSFMTTKEGEQVYYETWPAEAPRAVIQILTGLGEMAWYYEEFAEEANRRGYSVWLHEYRKHGRSEAGYGPFSDEREDDREAGCGEAAESRRKAVYGKGNIFLTFAADAAQLLEMIRRENPGKKVFLVCHSLGTGIGQFAVAKEGAHWDGIVMTGPSHRVIEPERFARLLEQAEKAIREEGPDTPSSEIYPEVFDGQNDEFAQENSPFSFITSDREKWEFIASLPFTSPDYSNRFYRDFLLMQGVMLDELALEAQVSGVSSDASQAAQSEEIPPAGSQTADLKAVSDTSQALRPDVRVPVLLLTGEQDVTSEHGRYAAVKAARLRAAGFPDVTAKSYPGLRHSILQETRRGEVVDDILRWIGERA